MWFRKLSQINLAGVASAENIDLRGEYSVGRRALDSELNVRLGALSEDPCFCLQGDFRCCVIDSFSTIILCLQKANIR